MATAISEPVTGMATSGLRATQIVVLAATGVVLWFVAAMLLRAIEPLGALDGNRVLLSYALVVPGTIPFVYLTRALARLRRDQTAMGITIVTASALLIDGVAVAFFPALYGANPTAAAAAVLWGAGVGLVLGLIMNGRG